MLAETDSTNAVLKRLAQEKIKISGCAIVAERQSAGRGRGEQHWYSPAGCNIYLSAGVDMPMAARFSGYSLAIGVGVARALKSPQVKLKWPNDILINGRKVGGILIESATDAECIVGIGLNVAMQPEDVTSEAGIDQPWTSLHAELGALDRDQLVVDLLEEISLVTDGFMANRLHAFMDEWAQKDAICGKRVRIELAPHKTLEGEALGVNSDGALQVDTGAGIESCLSGRLRLID